MEELLSGAGGSNETLIGCTQGLLNGFQSFAACCRLRTHLASVILFHNTDSDITDSNSFCPGIIPTNNNENNCSAHSRSEALLRQLLWLTPCQLSGDTASLSSILGIVSTEEPGSYVEQMIWGVGMKSVLCGGFFSTPGGLDNGTADHSVTLSPWISKCQSLLFTQCSVSIASKRLRF